MAESSVTISNPDKLLWAGVSKADLRNYYEAAADRLMRFIANRPLTIIRAPDGYKGEVFYQRHAMKGMSKLIGTVKVKGEPKPYLMITSAEALPALAQIAAVEIHPWASTAADLERPDYLTFDLDPDKGLGFADLRRAAFDMRDYLARLGLGAFLKVTGGKGLHVVVPLQPRAQWNETKEFARALVEVMAADRPDAYTVNIRKVRRKGRVFLDYLRNGRTATAVAAWSPRARDGAPLAVPIGWHDIERKRTLPRFTLDKASAAFKAADPWKDYEKCRRPLPSLDALKKL
jgi:bifunctional non-homologous end joining protein LigD